MILLVLELLLLRPWASPSRPVAKMLGRHMCTLYYTS